MPMQSQRKGSKKSFLGGGLDCTSSGLPKSRETACKRKFALLSPRALPAPGAEGKSERVGVLRSSLCLPQICRSAGSVRSSSGVRLHSTALPLVNSLGRTVS